MIQRISTPDLEAFIRESNTIEGLHRVTRKAIDAHRAFLEAETVGVPEVSALVLALAGAKLRDKAGMDVRVGNHVPPPGGPGVVESLTDILGWRIEYSENVYFRHRAYETLHPFMDSNGRSGRALWLRDMLSLGKYVPETRFLRRWYYQSLE